MANQYSFAQSNGGNNNANRLYLRTLSKISLFDVSQKIEKKIRSPPVWIPLADAGKSKSTSLFADLLTADWQPSLPNLYPDAESSDDDTPVRDNAAIYRDDMEEEEEEDVEPTAAAAAAEEPASLTQQVADFVSQKFGLTSAEGLKKVLCDLEEEAEKEQEEATTTRRLPVIVPAATEGEEVTASKDWPSHWIPVCATQAQMRWCDDAVNDANANADLYVCCEKSFDILNHPRFAFLDDDVNLATLGSQGSGKTFLLQKFLEKLSTAEKTFSLAVLVHDHDTEAILVQFVRDLGYPVEKVSTVLDENWNREFGVVIRTEKDADQQMGRPSEAVVDLIIVMDIRVLANNQVFSKVLTQDQQRPPTVWLVTRGSVEERIMQCLEMTDDARRNKRTWREVWEISERCRNAVRQANEWPPISDFDPLITASAENLAKRLLPVQRVPEVQFRIEQASEPVHAISHEQQPTLSVPSSPDSQASESSYSTLASTSQQPVQFEKSLKRKPAEAFDSMQEAAESQPNQKALANRKKKLRQFIASLFRQPEPNEIVPLLLSANQETTTNDMPDDNTLFQSLEELALPESVQGQLMEMKTQLQKDIAAVVEKLQKLYVQETEQLCVKYEQEALEAVMNNE